MSSTQTPTVAELDAEFDRIRRGMAEHQERYGTVPVVIGCRTKINGTPYSPGQEARFPAPFAAILVDLGRASRSSRVTPEEARRLDTALSERRGRYGNASLR